MNTLLLGRWGEALAAEYLRKKKYRVTAVNYRSRFGEIDLVAEDKKTVVFVEVKLRKNDKYGRASEFVTISKQKKIVATARVWMSQNPTEKVLRFDVIEINDNEINHIKNAFFA